eukprot:5989287-Prymnesium_polylepis.2
MLRARALAPLTLKRAALASGIVACSSSTLAASSAPPLLDPPTLQNAVQIAAIEAKPLLPVCDRCCAAAGQPQALLRPDSLLACGGGAHDAIHRRRAVRGHSRSAAR